MLRCPIFVCALALFFMSPVGFAQEKGPAELTDAEQRKLADEALKLSEEGVRLYDNGRPAEALGLLRKALAIRRKLYPESKYPDGHPEIAVSLTNVAAMLESRGQAEKALPDYEQALAMFRKSYPESLYPDGHAYIAMSLSNLGSVLQSIGQAERGVLYYEQALAMRRKLFPKSKFPDGHPDLALSLNNMGFILISTGQAEKALSFLEQALAMRRLLYPESEYPDGHADLAHSLSNVGSVLKEIGQVDRALPLLEQAVAMNRKLYPKAKYPNGHPELATSLNNLAATLLAADQNQLALAVYEQALAMRRQLYPPSRYPGGHPAIAASLSNLASALTDPDQARKALPLFEQALAMRRRLYPESEYPNGHPDLALGLNNLGYVLRAIGEPEKALPFCEQSLAMRRQLYPASKYPDGHREIATSLSNVGIMLHMMGQPAKALPFCEQALAMQLKQLQRELPTASEAAAFDRIAGEPQFRNTYLSVTRALPTSAATTYAALWPSRSLVTRVLEQRHARVRAAPATTTEKLDLLKVNRRRTEQLLQDTRMKQAERDKLLMALADERDRLERELIADLPHLKRWQELDQLGPNELMNALPPGTVFIDLVAYIRSEYGKETAKRNSTYVAFVLGPFTPDPSPTRGEGRETIQRIELGDAQPIHAAVEDWRNAIDARRDDRAAAQKVHDLIWANIAKSLPPETRTIYLAADGDLARIPWGAIRVADGRVVLEDYALAVVPHGAFLLDHLKFPRSFHGAGSALTLGAVNYDPSRQVALPGTADELTALARLASSPPVALTKSDATVERLTELLPQARYAHLATHGEFKADELRSERKRAAAALTARHFGDTSRSVA